VAEILEERSASDSAGASPGRFVPSAMELKMILARHRGWIATQPQRCNREDGMGEPLSTPDRYLDESEPATPNWRDEALSRPELAVLRNADLKGANLRGANLNGSVWLDGADLSGADLEGAQLRGAHLSGAKLCGANLSLARLSSADLGGADLSGANVSITDLRHAHLDRTNFNGANLVLAKMNNATLVEVNVTKATLAYADLTNAVYAPASEPPHPFVTGIKGLSKIRIVSGQEVGLVQLRKLLQDAGLRQLEREATYSIERARTLGAPVPLLFARLIAFDWTTAYGLRPARAIFLMMAIWLLCIPAYGWSIVHDPSQPHRESGIYRVLAKDRIDGAPPEPKIEKDPKAVRLQARTWLNALPDAAYFSLLSAVNIGFQQFTPGDWIRRLQTTEYALQAVGWPRVVAGTQALLSLFLLAMWVLTQFGRPFQ
jgi:uncharacterized protein YjbI with pentapeptide repeats